jgi:cell division protein ZipA
MESVSLILILVGAGIIGIVLLLRLGLRRKGSEKNTNTSENAKDIRKEEPDFDPLFAIDAIKADISDSVPVNMGKVMVEEGERQNSPSPSASPSTNYDAASQTSVNKSTAKRRPPRVADDPSRVVVLNVMAGENQAFAGEAVRSAVEGSGFEYGDWQIFHYYSHANGEAPPLFSLANMVKPGNFDLERMDGINTAGLSLFMVPAGEEDDVTAFNTMLGTAKRLAEELGGEVRDARRSVLTRQAIGHIREQLNEWRCKAQVAQH